MKTIPKTKHSNKFIKEKNQLIAKAVLDKKLDTIKKHMCDYLQRNPGYMYYIQTVYQF